MFFTLPNDYDAISIIGGLRLPEKSVSITNKPELLLNKILTLGWALTLSSIAFYENTIPLTVDFLK